MHLFKLPFLFLLLTGHALCNKKAKGICPNGDTLVKTFRDSIITKRMFASCNQLKSVVLLFGGSKTYNMEADALENLNNLEKFTLDSYKIPHIKKGFFKLTPSIKEIYLHFADIEKIDPDAFEDFKDLDVISIAYSKKLKHLPENLFKNLTKLTAIDLHENSLEGLTWEEFKGLTNVKVVNLSSNKISSFDAEKIAEFMPNLEILAILNNPVMCKDQEAFVEELKKKLNHSINVQYELCEGEN